jgi:hypothetical protein
LANNVLERADVVVVDCISQARKLSSELIEFCREQEVRWAAVRSLADIMEFGNLRSPNSDNDFQIARDGYFRSFTGH